MKKLSVILVLVLLISNSAFSQYTGHKYLLPFPTSTNVSGVRILTPQKWMAYGSYGLLMTTTNAGLNWNLTYNWRHGETLPYGIAATHFFDANTGLIGCTDGYIGRTTNGGATYDSIPSGTTSTIRRFYFMNAQTGYVCGYPGYLAKTTDAGFTWRTYPSVSSVPYIYNVAPLDTNTIMIAVQNGNIMRSTDAGLNWTTINTGFTNSVSDLLFVDNNTGFACGAANIRKSTDGGLTWGTLLNRSGQTWFDIAYFKNVGDPGGNNVLYFTGHNYFTYSNLYRSYDNGLTLDSIDMRNGTGCAWAQTTNIDRQGNLLISCNGLGMVAFSTNAGNNWSPSGTFLTNLTFNDVDYNASSRRLWAVANSSPGTVPNKQPVYSHDYGQTWNLSQTLLNWAGFSVLFTDSNTGYLSGSYGRIFKSINGGVTWDSLSTPITTSYNMKLFSSDPSTIFACRGDGVLLKTSNAGLNWITLSPGVTNAIQSGCAANTQRIYICGGSTLTGWIYSSTDGGQTFSQIYSTTSYIYRVKILPSGIGYASGSDGQLIKTTNFGANWLQTFPPTSGVIRQLEVYDDNTLYVNVNGFAGSAAVAKSTNGGNTWSLMGPNPDAISTNGFRVVHPDTVVATGGTGQVILLFNPNGSTSVEYNGTVIPLTHKLEQNYPNPFNPETTIKFLLSKQAAVSLVVFDISGREIESLYENPSANPGLFTVKLNASKYSSGVYFYSLRINGAAAETKKMVLLK